jgi:RNA recognition motif-containing protein
VHLIINRDSQRLLGCCFVEVPDIDSAKDMIAAKAKGRQYLRGKMVHVQLSTQNELKNTLFPKFYVRSNKTDIESGGVFLRRSEIFSLLELCKSIRVFIVLTSIAITK